MDGDVEGAASGGSDGSASLLAAVRAGDASLVKVLLAQDGSIDWVDEAFRLALSTRSGTIADLLLSSGADRGACPPHELPSLREAVESGSAILVELLLDPEVRQQGGEPELLVMRDLARRLHETGVESRLRRLTGSRDDLVRTRVRNGAYDSVDAYSLGGITVRDGYAAILTDLESLLGERTSFEELMARAVRHDQQHCSWGAATMLLSHRRDQETWAAAAALRSRPEPSHRLFGAEVLRLTHLFDDSEEEVFTDPARELFIDWSAREEDVAVLTEVLIALGEHCDLRAVAALVPFAGHRDSGVRRAVARGCGTWPEAPVFADDVRATLLGLMADVDAEVRQTACHTVAEGKDRHPALVEAMAALLDDADRQVRVKAVYGLALHDDERCVEGARRLPPAPPGTRYEFDLDAVWRYEWRRDGR
ncbi:hypothetical protein ACFYYB_39430 [Streptomyces sp. NPDC002886]|uniref:hypothetical protein n=1 Tax=Streptomyces sp. NPDC002886 TaxID=3364667 RepID=UPI0036CFF06F